MSEDVPKIMLQKCPLGVERRLACQHKFCSYTCPKLRSNKDGLAIGCAFKWIDPFSTNLILEHIKTYPKPQDEKYITRHPNPDSIAGRYWGDSQDLDLYSKDVETWLNKLKWLAAIGEDEKK